ncbi:MAG: hypothetical protein SOI38_07355, partial [Eggerthellaceae bacterium]
MSSNFNASAQQSVSSGNSSVRQQPATQDDARPVEQTTQNAALTPEQRYEQLYQQWQRDHGRQSGQRNGNRANQQQVGASYAARQRTASQGADRTAQQRASQQRAAQQGEAGARSQQQSQTQRAAGRNVQQGSATPARAFHFTTQQPQQTSHAESQQRAAYGPAQGAARRTGAAQPQQANTPWSDA